MRTFLADLWPVALGLLLVCSLAALAGLWVSVGAQTPAQSCRAAGGQSAGHAVCLLPATSWVRSRP